MSTFLKATVLEAVPAILDQHADFNELRLIAFLEKIFPQIPAHLRAAIVVAATAGARHTALLHVVHGSNINSPDASKRVFASEADSELSFWALELRATDRESGSPKSAAPGAPQVETTVATCASEVRPVGTIVATCASGAPPAETIVTSCAGTPAPVARALRTMAPLIRVNRTYRAYWRKCSSLSR